MTAEQAAAGGDLLITYTEFPDIWCKSKKEFSDLSWHDLCAKIHDAPVYISKRHCPLISLASYGDKLSDKQCIRNAANVQRVFGVEVDYDGEEIPPSEAAIRLSAAGLEAIIYTSPSHTEGAPRWRVLLPLSEPAQPKMRSLYVARANRALGGLAHAESFTLSQSFYFGRIRGAAYEVIETHGRCVDLAFDLEPLYASSSTNNGTSSGPNQERRTDDQLREAFRQGRDRYKAMLTLSSRWAARGLSAREIEAALNALLDESTTALNADGIDLRSRVWPMAESAARKFGNPRREQEPPDPRDYMPPDPEDVEPPEDERPPPEGEDAERASGETKDGFRLTAISAELLTGIPPRPWLYGRHYLRKMISATAATGGTGKTSVQTVEAVGMAVGVDLFSGHREPLPTGPLTVWIHNGEDPLDEIRRRIAAVLAHYALHADDLGGRLHITSGREQRIIMAREIQGTTIAAPETREAVQDAIRRHNIDVLILDPFIATHQVNENSNPAIELVTYEWRCIAETTNTAIDFTHHFRKGSDGEPNADAIRGASALMGSVRSARVMAPMSKEEAEAARIEPTDRRRYVYEVNAKANLHPATDERRWYYLATVTLDNATPPYEADAIGVATRWAFPTLYTTITPPMQTQALNALRNADPFNRRKYASSTGWAGLVVAAALEIDLTATDAKTQRKEIGQLLNWWESKGKIRKVDVYDPRQARNVPVYEVV